MTQVLVSDELVRILCNFKTYLETNYAAYCSQWFTHYFDKNMKENLEEEQKKPLSEAIKDNLPIIIGFLRSTLLPHKEAVFAEKPEVLRALFPDIQNSSHSTAKVFKYLQYSIELIEKILKQ